MALTRSQIGKILKQRDAQHDTNYSVWVGATAETAIQVLNDDNSVPFVRSLAAKEEILLGLDSSYTQQRKSWKATIAFNSFDYSTPAWLTETTLGNHLPDSNQQWWISSDDGTSKQRCNLWRVEIRGQQGYYWVYLVQ